MVFQLYFKSKALRCLSLTLSSSESSEYLSKV